MFPFFIPLLILTQALFLIKPLSFIFCPLSLAISLSINLFSNTYLNATSAMPNMPIKIQNEYPAPALPNQLPALAAPAIPRASTARQITPSMIYDFLSLIFA